MDGKGDRGGMRPVFMSGNGYTHSLSLSLSLSVRVGSRLRKGFQGRLFQRKRSASHGGWILYSPSSVVKGSSWMGKAPWLHPTLHRASDFIVSGS